VHTTLICLSAAVQFLLPAVILSFCTTRLVRALRESGRIQRRYWTVVLAQARTTVQYLRRYWTVVRATAGMVHSSSTSANQKGRRLTVILVAIVACSPGSPLHLTCNVIHLYLTCNASYRWRSLSASCCS